MCPRSDVGQFLIAGPPPVLGPLLDQLNGDPETDVVSVSRSPQGELRRLVVAMSPDRALALGAALGDTVLIEPNDPVNPL